MNEQLLSQELDNLLQVIEKLCEPVQDSEIKTPGSSGEMRIFMRKTLELYLLMQRKPSVKLDLKLQTYLNQSAALLSRRSEGSTFRNYHLIVFVMKLVDILFHTFYADEWQTRVCPLRSQIEAFNEIYKGTSYKEFIDEDFEETDAEIKCIEPI
ncbi:MAG TPA: hypothetical protein V6C84_09800 [Coleofasciculaceae cyanobacterium]|jgi:hypothetical protein